MIMAFSSYNFNPFLSFSFSSTTTTTTLLPRLYSIKLKWKSRTSTPFGSKVVGSSIRSSPTQSIPVESPSPSGGSKTMTSNSSALTIVEVDLGNRSYPVYIGSGLLHHPHFLQKHLVGKKVLVVTNTTIASLYLDKVIDALTRDNPEISVETVILPDGEKYKNMETLMKVFQQAIESRLDRRSTFLALGGGVIGDMCGFAASTFMRGASFIQVPTTVMAQVDSSVGGKTAINHPLGKNLIGSFYQPQCTLIDTDTLTTLSDRELSSGLAEVIKCGLIMDADFFKWQEENINALLAKNPHAIAYAIKRSCEIKAQLVSLDEMECGIRAILNFGHTFGHAIENGVGYGQWLHGEAIAVGMVMAADLSLRLGWIDETLVKRIHTILEHARLPTSPPQCMTFEMFKSIMSVDKKVADGVLRLVLLKVSGSSL
ncbi:3-dehydroquinate synthase, chloroplastic isoform X2 [Spinacia oleracea]|uniref:3-dehydroquinate synthase n=1 Tax=Spinacia oleracea TaxID=3562 RepID=A0ABM3RPW3_SPIOL|nr:3-dehydroquinate synthase, chloroplastic-like isoform X2 [Spinacia oleracea]